ncbi:pyridoxamine 5'-phosphate oxidase family protein [Ornithinimicrobium faecis]|uniref:Pyridoxamine 5'-phosphate oxidase family protein n=1 Tax=Ornithinimicrobium faecis TaxID=2934158 RepID=A0ABY4YRW7_9MICO|nr:MULTISPECIES: pyridoxamine 5'-phosphate oxidase family protein [unclassified Ornithinimicrobium]USQ79486.1 pyridoxamine 5'-phosphate oxidase family protein [Ornithinimicrobium sp. HY1793]
MASPEPRDAATRKADSLTLLTTEAIDAWVATASTDGAPHLVPLSLLWRDDSAVIALPESSVTARNIVATGRARLGVGPTRDVVLVDVVLDSAVGVETDEDLADAYAAQADWDPRGAEGYVYLILRPERVQAWREANEMVGRTLMREGAWLV